MVKKAIVKQENTYQGILIDFTGISEKLTEKERRFVFWFTHPGTDAFQHKKRAAIAAGYAPKNSAITGYKLSRRPQVIKEIEKVSKSINSETIGFLFNKYMNTLETRAFFDPADFITGTTFKKIEDIPQEKRICLEQPIFDRNGNVIGYQLTNRRTAMAEIGELYEKMTGGAIGNGQDAEETKEIIMERVTIRREKRREEAAEAAEYRIIKPATAEIEEEL